MCDGNAKAIADQIGAQQLDQFDIVVDQQDVGTGGSIGGRGVVHGRDDNAGCNSGDAALHGFTGVGIIAGAATDSYAYDLLKVYPPPLSPPQASAASGFSRLGPQHQRRADAGLLSHWFLTQIYPD